MKLFEKRTKGHHFDDGSKNFKSEPATREQLDEFLASEIPSEKNGAIYVHVPFCDNICSFCSMNRTKLGDELDGYCEYLLSEIEHYGKLKYIQNKSFGSIYFGGGTPTIFKEHHLERIINAIKSTFSLRDDVEFNFESTLHNLPLSKLKLMQDLGVNRYSIGIQTLSPKGRKFLNRVYEPEVAYEKLAQIRENFRGVLCTDIIYNFPNEEPDEVINDAKMIKKIGVDSSSFYSLQLLENAKIADQEIIYKQEKDIALHHAFVDEMSKDGYDFMELTKMAKIENDRYEYIRLMHKGYDMLPLGKGSGGSLGDYSIFSPRQGLVVAVKKTKAERDYKRFLNLFQYANVEFSEAKELISQNAFDELHKFLKTCESENLLKMDENGFKLTKDGVFWGNSIANEVAKFTIKDFL